MRLAFLYPLLLPLLCGQSRPVSMTNWYKHANFYQAPESRVMLPNPQTNQLELAYQFTPEYELSLGHQAFQQLTQGGVGVVNDPELQNYLQGLIARISTATPGPNFSYRVVVLNAPDVVNAVTPPGYVVVYTGLFSKIESEGELVAVLSHELAHNYAHHVVRQVAKSAYTQAAVGAVMNAIQRKNAAVQIITGIGAQMGAGLFMKAYSRFEEKEADLYGAHLMYNAGYNPMAMRSFFARLAQDRPRQPAKLLSTHPSDPDRVSYIGAYVQGFPLGQNLAMDSETFHSVKSKLGFGGLTREGPATPATEQPVAPTPPTNAGPGVLGSGNRVTRAPRLTEDTPATPQLPGQPNIPDPPATAPPPQPPPTTTVTRPPSPGPPTSTGGPVVRSSGDGPQLDPKVLDDFIRKTVPPGARTATADREGQIVFLGTTGGDVEDSCPPGKCGDIVWDGDAKKGMMVTINGDRASVGTLEGGLPGTPVKVTNDMPADLVTLIEQPSARNGWKRLVFRLNFEGGFTFSLRWKML